MQQFGLFDYSPPPEELAEPEIVLRPYQEETVTRVFEELKENRGTLALLATGLGKTQIACEVIRKWPGRCLFVAHRDELIQQASKRIEQFTGMWPEIEQAQDKANAYGDNHVVASIQTLSRPKRLERFDPSEFDLMVIDEVHHGTSPTYRRVIDYFGDTKILGLTATPDRLDGEALGQILDSVAHRYDIHDGIRDGWLCEIVMRMIKVKSLNFAKVKTVAGDFNKGELDAIMQAEENLHAVARPTVELAGDRKTLVFTTSVAAAEKLAEIIDRYSRPGAACVVSGGTDKEIRRQTLRAFGRGEHQFFVNVGIATEGYDEPGISCVVMGRPTKSRSLFVQMLGRGTRGGKNCPVPGKSDCLVLDFVGVSGRHDVVCAADVLGGNISERRLEAVKDEIKEAGEEISIEEAQARADAKAEEAERKAREDAQKAKRSGIRASVDYVVGDSDPFSAFSIRRDYLYEKYGYNKASDRTLDGLGKWMKKHAKDLPPNLSQHEASRLMKTFANRAKQGLCSYPQMKLLSKYGHDARLWSFEQASAEISKLAARGWRKSGRRFR